MLRFLEFRLSTNRYEINSIFLEVPTKKGDRKEEIVYICNTN